MFGTYAEHSARIIAALSERYGKHPAVMAWQIDNELGNHSTGRCHCDQCRTAFQRWCHARCGQLTLTIRSFIKDQDNVWTDQPMPAGLTELVGGQIKQWYALPPGNYARYELKNGASIAIPIWVEDIQPHDACAALQYVAQSVPGLSHLTSVSSRAYGAHGGRVHYVGVYPPDPSSGLFSGTVAVNTGSAMPLVDGTLERISLSAGELVLNHAPGEQWSAMVKCEFPAHGLDVSSAGHPGSTE